MITLKKITLSGFLCTNIDTLVCIREIRASPFLFVKTRSQSYENWIAQFYGCDIVLRSLTEKKVFFNLGFYSLYITESINQFQLLYHLLVCTLSTKVAYYVLNIVLIIVRIHEFLQSFQRRS